MRKTLAREHGLVSLLGSSPRNRDFLFLAGSTYERHAFLGPRHPWGAVSASTRGRRRERGARGNSRRGRGQAQGAHGPHDPAGGRGPAWRVEGGGRPQCTRAPPAGGPVTGGGPGGARRARRRRRHPDARGGRPLLTVARSATARPSQYTGRRPPRPRLVSMSQRRRGARAFRPAGAAALPGRWRRRRGPTRDSAAGGLAVPASTPPP